MEKVIVKHFVIRTDRAKEFVDRLDRGAMIQVSLSSSAWMKNKNGGVSNG